MKRRFAVTLLAVAIAVVSASAFARAPVIGAIRNVVIADDTPITDSNLFVYPDAINLNDLAVDPEGVVTSDSIIWSYDGTGRYRLNDRNVMSGDPNNPASAELVGAAGLDDPDAVDSDVRTVTFRDNDLSPVGGPDTDPDPGVYTSSTIASELVTLFASDGTSYSMKDIWVYTENNGVDRLSGAGMIVDPPVTPGTAAGWFSASFSQGTGTLTSNDTIGTCIEVPAAGDNYWEWISPYKVVELVQNNVYRFRLDMTHGTGAALAAGTTPFWDVYLDNFNHDNAAEQKNKFTGDFMNWDTNGNANAVGPDNLNQFDFWWCPASINSASWNDPASGEFIQAKDGANDLRLHFRIMDLSTNTDTAGVRGGTVCLDTFGSSRIPISQLTAVGAPLYDVETLEGSTPTHAVGTVFGGIATAAGNNNGRTVVTFSGGDLTVQPNTSITGQFAAITTQSGGQTPGRTGNDAWDLEIINIDMGDSTVDFGVGSTLDDNWPVPWESNKLLKGTVTMKAPNQAGELTPPDAITLAWDEPSNELLLESAIVSNDDISGMPQESVETDYVSFFYTHNKTASTATNFDRIRLRVYLLCNMTINSGSNVNNLGGVTITKMKVEEVEVPAFE